MQLNFPGQVERYAKTTSVCCFCLQALRNILASKGSKATVASLDAEGDPERRSAVDSYVHEHPSTGSNRAIDPEKLFRVGSTVSKIYNIPSDNSLVDVLAEKLLTEYKDNLLGLTDVLILLPNRRACREMRDSFVRLRGMTPTLLPVILPIADVEEDEIFFANADISLVPPAMSVTERLMIFIRLITAKPADFEIEKPSFAQACFLANELASLMDITANEGLNFDKLDSLVPAEYAAHWQKTLNFLKIITLHLPAILKERGMVDAASRRSILLRLENKTWQQNPPQNRIIIAGTTATFPAMKELVKTVSELPNGEVYLAGIDKHLDDNSWEQIDEPHPQFELKELLHFLEISRFDIADVVQVKNPARLALISETMRPAKTTDQWRNISPLSPQAVDGLKIITCREIREEALAIALVMRYTLETPEKTAALVTTDRNLARRVSAELKRWNITVDDSAGQPLSQTPCGIFLRLIAKVVETDFDAIDFMSMLKHPFFRSGKERNLAREYEKKVLRKGETTSELDRFLLSSKEPLQSLEKLLKQKQADFAEILKAHLSVAETIAGPDTLWKGDAGETAAKLFGDLLENAAILGDIPQGQYLDLLQAIFATVTVRPKYGTHPRLKILGPIEARLTKFDTVIIGEVNEGTFPAATSVGPWLSRPMKKDFGFPLPEKATGVLAHDFSQLLAANEIYLTRAERVQGTPTVKSRWLMRLETVLAAGNINIKNLYSSYSRLANSLDKTAYAPIKEPKPRPSLSLRPRKLWASAVENLMRDPYMVYAKYILRLEPLDDINQELSPADFGSMVHKVLEIFNKKYPASLPADILKEMSVIGESVFAEYDLPAEVKAFWHPNFLKMVDWLAAKEKDYRTNISVAHSEVSGSYSFDAPGGQFTLSAKADRVDETIDGKINIIDFKTGKARTKKEVKSGYAPQLPIEGIIAANGGFEGISAKMVKNLIYWQLGVDETVIDDDIETILGQNLANIKELIAQFDDLNTAYQTQPNPKYAPKYSDYEHLSRIKEWGVIDDNE